MKKVLWLGIIFSFIFLGNHTVAVGQTTPTSFNYTFNASAVGSTVKVTVGGATGSKSTYQLLIQTTPPPTTPPSQGIFNNTQTPNSKGVMTWSVPETANVTYYVAVVEIPSNTYTLPAYVGSPQTVQTSVAVAFNPLVIAPAPAFDPGFILVQGKINTAKEPHYATYKIYLTYSQNADLSNPINTEWQSFIDNHLDNKQGISTGTDTNGDTDPNGPGITTGYSLNLPLEQHIIYNKRLLWILIIFSMMQSALLMAVVVLLHLQLLHLLLQDLLLVQLI
jgi:hypothetical protein